MIADLDDDSWPDIFVANDSVPNVLFRRTGPWRYEDVALLAGVAVASDGTARAGMGVDAADYDGDGRLDLAEQPRRHRGAAPPHGGRTNAGARGEGRVELYLGQNDLRQHFGLGEETRVERLEVKPLR